MKVKHSSEVKEFMVGIAGHLSPCIPLCKNIFISYIYVKIRLFATPWIIQSMGFSRPLEWVAILFSRGSSQPRDRICVSCFVDGFFMTEPQGSPVYCILASISYSRWWSNVITFKNKSYMTLFCVCAFYQLRILECHRKCNLFNNKASLKFIELK